MENECKLVSMHLKVDEIGWKGKVLAPFDFKFNYCAGDCRPIEFKPVPLIVNDEGLVKLRIYDNLLVTKCG